MASLMSGMSGNGGMGMDTSLGGMFIGYNRGLAHAFWYLIAALVALSILLRASEALQTRSRSAISLPEVHENEKKQSKKEKNACFN